jgi:tRNA 2-thiouridine synthesizing protein A
MAPVTSDTLLDLRGLKCPLPALKLRKALTRAGAGEVLRVECTDPMAAIDIPHLLNETGDALLDQERVAELLVFRVRKA